VDLQARHAAALRAANRSERTIGHYADSFKTLYWSVRAQLPGRGA
jgi:hypothetical protein